MNFSINDAGNKERNEENVDDGGGKDGGAQKEMKMKKSSMT
ncbi:MAG: hypothetical protein ACRD8Z_06250 [Nitrososphaeraceae archaeon]